MTVVVRVTTNPGFPFQARCECGWQAPKTYVFEHQAESVAKAHLIECPLTNVT